MTTDVDATSQPLDGRVARRERNIDAVIDVVLEMFAEDSMFPTIEQAAKRSGLSLRSLYRYFADPGELLEAAIKRSDQVGAELSKLHAIGQGSLADRVEAFVAMRLRLHERLGPMMRATRANAHKHERVQEELATNRKAMLEQFEMQFAPELAKLGPSQRKAILAAGDVLTQIDSVDYLRRHRELSVADTKKALTTGLFSLLGTT